jgi:hypothetical protein
MWHRARLLPCVLLAFHDARCPLIMRPRGLRPAGHVDGSHSCALKPAPLRAGTAMARKAGQYLRNILTCDRRCMPPAARAWGEPAPSRCPPPWLAPPQCPPPHRLVPRRLQWSVRLAPGSTAMAELQTRVICQNQMADGLVA